MATSSSFKWANDQPYQFKNLSKAKQEASKLLNIDELTKEADELLQKVIKEDGDKKKTSPKKSQSSTIQAHGDRRNRTSCIGSLDDNNGSNKKRDQEESDHVPSTSISSDSGSKKREYEEADDDEEWSDVDDAELSRVISRIEDPKRPKLV